MSDFTVTWEFLIANDIADRVSASACQTPWYPGARSTSSARCSMQAAADRMCLPPNSFPKPSPG